MRVASAERVDVGTLRADRWARAAAYAEPAPAALHVTALDLRDAGDAGKVLLHEARMLGLVVTVGRERE